MKIISTLKPNGPEKVSLEVPGTPSGAKRGGIIKQALNIQNNIKTNRITMGQQYVIDSMVN